MTIEISKENNIGLDAFIYGIYAALIPYNMILNYSGRTINTVVGLVSGFLICISILFRKLYRRFTVSNHYLLIYLIYALFTFVWTVNSEQSYGAYITIISLYFLFAVGSVRNFNSKETAVIVFFMIIFAAAVPAFLAANTAISYSRATLTSEAGVADQNSLAVNIGIAGLLALDGAFKRVYKVEKIILITLATIIFIGVLMTGSRGAVFSIVSAIVYYFIRTTPQIYKSKRLWISILSVCGIIIIVYVYAKNNINAVIFDRFSWDTMFADGGSGRLLIWGNLLKIAFENPFRLLFGYGFGAEQSIYLNLFGGVSAAHNVFLEMLVEVGIIGLVIYLLMLGRFWKSAIASKSAICSSLIIILFATFITLGYSANKGCWNVFLLVALYSRQNMREQPKSENGIPLRGPKFDEKE